MADDAKASGETRSLALARGGSIELAAAPDGDERLVVRSREGQAVLTVRLTEQGPVISIAGAALEIESATTLSLRCERLDVRAKEASIDVAGSLVERVGGDAIREAAGVMEMSGATARMIARDGGATITANDDVDLLGERVRLNSQDPPMPLSMEEFEARRRERALSQAGAGGPEELLGTVEDAPPAGASRIRVERAPGPMKRPAPRTSPLDAGFQSLLEDAAASTSKPPGEGEP